LLILTRTAGRGSAPAGRCLQWSGKFAKDHFTARNLNPGSIPGDAENRVGAMKPSQPSGVFRPFQDLRVLLERKSFPIKPSPSSDGEMSADREMDSRNELALFKEAMTGVREISRKNCLEKMPGASQQTHPENGAECEPIVQLTNLVKYGTGFIVAHTPEYIEGTGYHVNPEVARRLHRGEFSIQAHIDLHGLGVKDARRALDGFLNESILTGKRTVIIIHGRGLSSPAEPILKSKVYQWLTSTPWNKRVIAFTSARLCDGGTGATYVLLRRRPLKKAYRKKKKRKDFIDMNN
jgi:DNA-nicking Smr family endonuclease